MLVGGGGGLGAQVRKEKYPPDVYTCLICFCAHRFYQDLCFVHLKAVVVAVNSTNNSQILPQNVTQTNG